MSKKKKKSTAPAPTPTAEETSAEDTVESAAGTAADAAPASADGDSAEAVSTPGEQTTAEEDSSVVVSSVEHTTTVADEEPSEDETPTDEEQAQNRADNAEFSMIDEATDNPYRNVFIESLAHVTADDLGKPPKKKKKDPVDVIIELFRKAIFWAAVVAFFVSGYQVVSKLYSYRQSEAIYGEFENIFEVDNRREDLVATATRSPSMGTLTPVNVERPENDGNANGAQNSQYNEKLLIIQGQLQLLRNKNKEVSGWIEMPGDTKINYPVVQGADNDYYLHYAYDGTYNPAGSIYMDYRNKITVSTNRHTIIYGHNMESGTPMFANLLNFRDASYWKNNRYVNIYTDDALYTYEVFAAYETSPQQAGVENHPWRMNFNQDDQLFLKWVDTVRARSDISPNVAVEANDRILTLSTCMNVNENRYVVHAVLVEVTKQ